MDETEKAFEDAWREIERLNPQNFPTGSNIGVREIVGRPLFKLGAAWRAERDAAIAFSPYGPDALIRPRIGKSIAAAIRADAKENG